MTHARPSVPHSTSPDAAPATPRPLSAENVIFLFSLPRSGSTLLQRILMQSPEVYATAEPWFLLPLLQPLRPSGSYTDYDSATSRRAMAALPDGMDRYRRAARTAALQLYGELLSDAKGATRFLDKSPRYHLVAQSIMEIFPESRAIILWRNPLSVTASIMSTWNADRWNLYNYRSDLYLGVRALLQTQRRWADRVQVVRYEDLVTHPLVTTARLFDALGLPFDEDVVRRGAAAVVSGPVGDKTGQHAYSEVTRAPLRKFEQVLANPLRQRWARRYLQWLGEDALAMMGYSHEETFGELERLPFHAQWVVSDLVRRAWGQVAVWTEPQILRDKASARRQGWPGVRHR